QAEARAATSSLIPDQVLPYSIQWTLGVQQQLHNDYTVEVRYVGTRGVHLLVQNQMFRFAPVQPGHSLSTYLTAPSQATLDALPLTLAQLQNNLTAARNPVLGPYGFASTITWLAPLGKSMYHGLAAQSTRRFSRPFQCVETSTWSHTIHDGLVTHYQTFLTLR